MKVVALVPFWEQYENNEFRIKKIAGRYMLSHSLKKLNNIEGIDDIYIYSSNENFAKYIEGDIHYKYLKRPLILDDSDVTIEMIINHFLDDIDADVIDADVIVLLHPTAPLLKIASIQACVNNIIQEGFDASFTAIKHNNFSWYNNKPINYDLNEDIPKLKEIEPLYTEQASLYIFKSELFKKKGHRVAGDIKITEIDKIEGLEIRNLLDFELAELIINSGMYNEVKK